jgi:signal transduction histidine kinase
VTDEAEINRLRHDLRTPLTVVIGFAELLASDRKLTDDQRRDYASRVLGAGVEMRELIDSAQLGSSAGHPDRG